MYWHPQETYYSYKEQGLGDKVLLIKPGKDSKGNKNIISRNGNTIPVDFLIDEQDNICEKLAYTLVTKDIKCILVDEAQFLREEHIKQLTDIVDYHNVDVICYGLRADFQTHLFPGSKRLFELADTIEEMKTVCQCNKKATMNTRIINGNFVFEGEQVAIDGEDEITYDSLCRSCYKKEKSKILTKRK